MRGECKTCDRPICGAKDSALPCPLDLCHGHLDESKARKPSLRLGTCAVCPLSIAYETDVHGTLVYLCVPHYEQLAYVRDEASAEWLKKLWR